MTRPTLPVLLMLHPHHDILAACDGVDDRGEPFLLNGAAGDGNEISALTAGAPDDLAFHALKESRNLAGPGLLAENDLQASALFDSSHPRPGERCPGAPGLPAP